MQTLPAQKDLDPSARIHIDAGFEWDKQDAYLFDIDGTLMRSRDRIHFDAFISSVRQVLGVKVSLDGVLTSGGTDTTILREACRLAAIPDEQLEPKLEAILDAMCQTVAAQRNQLQLYLMPGVEAALGHLQRRGALLGLATGNLERIGWIKIEQAGLRHWFRLGGFSDHFPIRSELVGNAAQMARKIAGVNSSVCVVGDTPRDIEAARANSLPVIAVATGRYSYDDLLALHPQVCATSLADLLVFTQAAS